MILKSLKYHRHIDFTREWGIEGKDSDLVNFGNINLLVGKNAVGKSRTLTVIKELAQLLTTKMSAGEVKFKTSTYNIILGNNDENLEYYLSLESGVVKEELVTRNTQVLFERSSSRIYIENKDSYEKITLPPNKLITQYDVEEDIPFITQLQEWGFSVRDSVFSDQIEKKSLARSLEDLNYKLIQRGETYSLIQIFEKGHERFGEEYIFRVLNDMKFLGYDLESIDIVESKKGYAISVKEKDLDFKTSQLDMSQGMYRALSLIIRVNYAVLNQNSVCFLVDDLGEGLDFDRSNLVVSLILKALNENTLLQVFLTTNDRYIMNKVPIKYWSVIVRDPKTSVFYNYQNSKEIFDDFKYTGLSNFDFLATDFYLKGFEDQDESEEV